MKSSLLGPPSIALFGLGTVVAAALTLPACEKDSKDNPGTGGASSGAGGSNTGDSAGGTTDDTAGSGGTSTSLPPPGTDGYDCSPAEEGEVELALREFASGFERPVLITHAPDDERLFVLEQRGEIHIISADGTRASDPFLDIKERVLSPDSGMGNNERGLLGLAFHPDYAENGLFYVHYSSRGNSGFVDGTTVIAEYHVSSDANVADSQERIVLTVNQDYSNHNGGTITFGGDGYLYIGLGDGGSGNDPKGHGQNEKTLLGSLLRIDPTGSSEGEYSSPADNLASIQSGAAPEIWDIGLRNPYRFNFDGCNGDLYIGDVGQDHWEEINIEPAGQGRKNYGWKVMEGNSCRGENDASSCSQNGFVAAVHDYTHRDDSASVTGGTVYRGKSIPSFRGSYLFADFQIGKYWSFAWDRKTQKISSVVDHSDSLQVGSPSSLQNGSDGEIYVTSLGGRVYKLVGL